MPETLDHTHALMSPPLVVVRYSTQQGTAGNHVDAMSKTPTKTTTPNRTSQLSLFHSQRLAHAAPSLLGARDDDGANGRGGHGKHDRLP